jgi:hypothetical protein
MKHMKHTKIPNKIPNKQTPKTKTKKIHTHSYTHITKIQQKHKHLTIKRIQLNAAKSTRSRK